MSLQKTWRWFGPQDNILLQEIKQTGVEGIVTALHHIPNGEIWPVEEIIKIRDQIESAGLLWSVVESLPVREEIKRGAPNRDGYISNYVRSLENLGSCGIDTVVYNFMPVIDWVRTDIEFRTSDGRKTMLFDYPVFVAFDVFVLERPGADKDYPAEILQLAERKYEEMSAEEAERLAYNIIVLTQGFIDSSVGDTENYKNLFLHEIEQYREVTEDKLRENLVYFLHKIMPVADRFNIKMCIHPDDPPFPVLGLPRIVSTLNDLKWLTGQHPSLNNGITFCTGSLSARKDNNLPGMIKSLGSRIHFAHLRSTRILENRSFCEVNHLEGEVDMYNVLLELLKEQQRRIQEGNMDYRIPVRPDHGLKLLDDFNRSSNPGYPLIGRLKGLSEITGMEKGIEMSGLHRDTS